MGHCRHLGGQNVSCTFVFQTPVTRIHPESMWVQVMLRHFLSKLSLTASFMNTPRRSKLVALSRDFYVVLTLKNCRRASFLLPAEEENATLEVTGPDGCKSYWKPDQERSHMSGYLEAFFKQLFPEKCIKVHDSLDGHRLVHYQGALRREDWDYAKPVFEKAFLAHRSAYRRAHGGCSGPVVLDRADARRQGRRSLCSPREGPQKSSPLVVRNSFLHFEDACEPQRLRAKSQDRHGTAA